MLTNCGLILVYQLRKGRSKILKVPKKLSYKEYSNESLYTKWFIICPGNCRRQEWIHEKKPELTFLCKKYSADEHNGMDGQTYEKWFEEQLLVNCPPKSLIVKDNSKYHLRKTENFAKNIMKQTRNKEKQRGKTNFEFQEGI